MSTLKVTVMRVNTQTHKKNDINEYQIGLLNTLHMFALVPGFVPESTLFIPMVVGQSIGQLNTI